MKAVTIWQPYAGAVAAGLKSYETRSWPTRYRGPIAIHASVRPVKGDARRLAETYGLKAEQFGEIVAYADLTDCLLMTPDLIAAQSRQELDFGDWRPGDMPGDWKISACLGIRLKLSDVRDYGISMNPLSRKLPCKMRHNREEKIFCNKKLTKLTKINY